MALSIREKIAFLAAGAAAAYGLARVYQRQQETIDALHDQLDDIEHLIRSYSIVETRQTQSLFWLHDQFATEAPLPLMRHWAISPDFATYLVQLLREYQPKNVLELGGGTSTIITGEILKQLGAGHVTAVEGMAEYAEKTREHFERHALCDIASIIHAPLTETDLHGKQWLWYNVDMLRDVQDIDFLLVDGPAQFNNPRRMARYPALPLFYDRLVPGAIILLDDSNREDEQRIAHRWLKEFDDLTLVKERDEFEKGAIVLQKSPID